MPSIRLQPVDNAGNLLAVLFTRNETLNDWVKRLPGAKWHPGLRAWTVPGSPETLIYMRDHKPDWLNVSIPQSVITRFKLQVAALNEAAAVRTAGDSAIAFDYVTKPYAHQRAGLDFLVKLGSGALLWEMGLGKTKTAIDYAEWGARQAQREPRHPADGVGLPGAPSTFRVLVIAPNTVARNWQNEIRLHAGHEDFVGLTGMSIAKRIELLGSARYSIVNCEALAYDLFAKACLARQWDLVIVDESTRFKNPKAQRTKALLKLAKRADHRLILTGTPITGSPEDAWAQMEFVQPGVFGSWYSFIDRFTIRDYFKTVIGVRAEMVPELASRIGRRSYRVLKSEVLDLPEKVYVDRVVELAGEQKKAYEQMREELRVEIEGMERVTAASILTVLLRLTQITSGLVGGGDAYTWLPDNAKVTELDNLLNDELKGEQVVIFGLYQKELEALAARYSEIGVVPPIIYGPTPEKRRHELITEFQAGDRRLLFCQIRTGGIGINLTAAQTAIYYSRSWSLEEYLQSQDRLHRIGQKGTVSIVHLLAASTVDMQIGKALAGKQKLADSLTGDEAKRLIASVLGE